MMRSAATALPRRNGTITAAIPISVNSSRFFLPWRVIEVASTSTPRLRASGSAPSPRQYAIHVSSHAAAVSAARNPQRSCTAAGVVNKVTAGAKQRRVFLLDVNPICYDGARPDLRFFAYWLLLFFTQVSLRDPVIAVLDGDKGNDYRRQLLPSYKAHRRRLCIGVQPRAERHVSDVLRNCRVPVVKVNGYEADDVVATLTDQVLQSGHHVVIASPDKDFKQLISEDVQMVMPIPEFGRWSFYTLKHYLAQYNCDPSSDLSLRCILGDEVDGVPGIQHLVPGFGRKTAMKLLRKHGSLENLLSTAAIRTVGKQYAQEALTKYGDYLRRNHQVLSLRRNADICIEDDWLSERDMCDDLSILSSFVKTLDEMENNKR